MIIMRTCQEQINIAMVIVAVVLVSTVIVLTVLSPAFAPSGRRGFYNLDTYKGTVWQGGQIIDVNCHAVHVVPLQVLCTQAK